MVYTSEVKQYVNSKFKNVLKICGDKEGEILYKISLCNEEEKFLMKYLYASMNLSDMASYDFEVYYEYVKHAIYLRENTPWGDKIPEDIFLNYVLHYRVNNEAIEDCRKVFYDMLYQRLENKSMYEAILEVNYWCAEKATYKSTDERTASPMTLLKCGYGRCGEESTFTVTALRSVGIPARQIYTPRWAHCDDNHAWVEVWCDGQWHYLGACEPEPVLDKGWFTSAASRAMVIHSRIFSEYFNDEDVISKNKAVTTINNIRKYANSKNFSIKVVDSKNKPISGVKIRIEILNYSEFTPIAILNTDENGTANINIGAGTIVVHLVKDNKFFYKVVNTKDLDEVVFNADDFGYTEEKMDISEIDKENNEEQKIREEDINIIPPSDKRGISYNITEDKKSKHKKRLENCNKIREERNTEITKNIIKEIDNIEKNQEFIKGIDNIEELNTKGNGVSYSKGYTSKVKDILLYSMGNYNEILEFLNCSYNNNKFEEAINLLMCLPKKDYIDSKANILNSHINHAIKFLGDYPKEIYFKYVICPRIYLEALTDYRGFIINYFNNSLKESFIKTPIEIWNHIKKHIIELKDFDYEELYTPPVALLKTGIGSLMSKKILFVAICRSLGIPARINKTDLSIEYYDKVFTKIEDESKVITSKVIVNNANESELKYFQNWTMSVLKDGIYKTLNLNKDIQGKDKISINIEPGYYRILTSNRLPNGSVFIKKYVFEVNNDEIKSIDITLRDAKISDMVENYDIEDLNIRDKSNNLVSLSELVKDKKSIIIWIEEGSEPTEHILNEMIEMHKDFINIKCQIIFIVKDVSALKNKTMQKVYELIPSIKTYFDDFKENVDTVARRMYLDPDKLPLILIADRSKKVEDSRKYINGIYATNGYNVGTAELIIRII
ncbi:transglutaminase-like domain-containing protein [Clostridium amazonitimonense]|uniref:transglutaminase-like domain-containing protein n=1 Tax=Clostridium amazonitimonense TaxID=1499689 RepID=UPI00050946D2|nr:transglutaminase-like domain-containing protein [Clostridium amazonitimonense]